MPGIAARPDRSPGRRWRTTASDTTSRERTQPMSETTTAPTFKPKKSVALSGVAAGNTALCTVGRSGNDLQYRGYDILEIAERCSFEEIAYLLVHGGLPTRSQLVAYWKLLRGLRGVPSPLRSVLEQLPANTHPMDVLRTATSTLGCVEPESD